MAVKPILFNTEMVMAILDGRKTVTRRLVKPHYKDGDCGYRVVRRKIDDEFCYIEYTDEDECGTGRYLNPPFQAGDVLYVRETWSAWSRTLGTMPRICYKADGEDLPGVVWKPSIHMPKEIARLWLRVVNVRAEELHDISGGELLKEGIDLYQSNYVRVAFNEFAELWDSTISQEELQKYGWDANPYVWRIEFEMVGKQEVEDERNG